MPVGTTRRKERDASPERQHIVVHNPAVVTKESVKASQRDDEAYERMRELKERYGDASALGKKTD
jgi:hypothetical protein